MIRGIRTGDDPVLRERARELGPEELWSNETQRLIDDMIETRRDANGAGLAAPQVGESLRIAVIENDGSNPRYPYKPVIPLTVIVNPVIEAGEESLETINEGCLSLPDLRVGVPRAMSITIRYIDRDGMEHTEQKHGLTAGTFQHEVDHLDGTLITRRAGTVEPTSWAEYERNAREEFEARAAAIVERYGS